MRDARRRRRKEAIAPVTEHFLAKLQAVLQRICANPTNPVFNHYMFETIAALVKFVCAANPGAVAKFEAILFPPFQTVLAQGVEQFVPYCLQILAQMLELRSGAPSQAYLSLFAPTLSPMLWEVRGNVPALPGCCKRTSLKYPNESKGTNPQQVQAILGNLPKVLVVEGDRGLRVLDPRLLITSLPLQTFQTHLTQVMHLALTRLQSSNRSSLLKRSCTSSGARGQVWLKRGVDCSRWHPSRHAAAAHAAAHCAPRR